MSRLRDEGVTVRIVHYEQRFAEIKKNLVELAYDHASQEFEGLPPSDSATRTFNRRVYQLAESYAKGVQYEVAHDVRDYLGERR